VFSRRDAFGVIHVGLNHCCSGLYTKGIEWVTGILSRYFFVVGFTILTVWGRNLDIGHVFRFPPAILFPFSQKQGIFSW
jgi:hypothetical protein